MTESRVTIAGFKMSKKVSKMKIMVIFCRSGLRLPRYVGEASNRISALPTAAL
jgi:hypothetical protein